MDTVRKLLDAGENPNVTDFAGKLYNNQISYGWDEMAIIWLDAFFSFLIQNHKKTQIPISHKNKEKHTNLAISISDIWLVYMFCL